jgi:serine phosphatase RsbU (regulator of sigma subunit)
MNRKLTILLVTLVQAVVLNVLVVWSIVEWNRSGWVGLSYMTAPGSDDFDGYFLNLVGYEEGEVMVVVPGSPAGDAGFRSGDRVLKINGVPINDLPNLRQLAEDSGTGDAIRYLVSQNGKESEIVLHLETPYRLGVVWLNTASGALVALLYLVISLLVMWSKPGSRSATLFYLLCTSGAATLFVLTAAEIHISGLRGLDFPAVGLMTPIVLAVFLFLSVFIGNVLMHFVLVFPKPRPILSWWPKLPAWLHITPFLSAMGLAALFGGAALSKSVPGLLMLELGGGASVIVMTRSLLRHGRADGLWKTFRDHPARLCMVGLLVVSMSGPTLRFLDETTAVLAGVFSVFGVVLWMLAVLLAYSIATCIVLHRAYRDGGADQKRQLRWPLWGTVTSMVASAVILIALLPLQMIEPELRQAAYYLSSAGGVGSKTLSLLIPLSFAFAILKYRLMDVDILIRKTVVYTVISGLIVAMYFVLSGVFGLVLVRAFGIQSQAVSVLTTLSVVVAFVPVRRGVQRVFSAHFFKQEHNRDEALKRIRGLAESAQNVEDLLTTLIEELQKALDCRAVAVFLDPGSSGVLSVAATLGLSEHRLTEVKLASDTWVAQPKKAVRRVAELVMSARERKVLEKVEAHLVSGVRSGGRAVGLITVGRRLSKEPFADEDLAFIEKATAQLALAIETTRGVRTEAELEEARQIQEALLPTEIPQIEGVDIATHWQPALKVAGDYFDVIRFGDHRVGLCIGDVVGKGLPAALLMSSLQAAVRAVADTEAEPHQVVEQVCRVVARNLTGGKFVTFFYGVIDAQRKTFTYTNAGHNPGLLVRQGELRRLGVGGPVIARLLRGKSYEQEEVQLEPDDRVVLFTDGVTEAQSASGEMFGDERLEELICSIHPANARELQKAIVDSASAFANELRQDDLTLITAMINVANPTSLEE